MGVIIIYDQFLQAWARHKILYYQERWKRNGLKWLTLKYSTWVGVVNQMNKSTKSVADPDLQMRRGRIQTLHASVWSKKKKGGPLPLIHHCKWDLRAHIFKAPLQDNSLSKWGSMFTILHLQTHVYHWNIILTTTTTIIIIILIVVNVFSLLSPMGNKNCINFIVGPIRTAISGTLETFPILKGSIKYAKRSGANKAHNTSEFKHTLHNHFSWSIFCYSYCLYKWGKKCNHFI